MTSPAGASRSRSRPTPVRLRGGVAALLPVGIPRPRPWSRTRGKSAAKGPGRAARARIGVDLVPVAQVCRVFEGRRALLATVFTDEELRYCTRQRRPFMHLAARFAVKEAALKALGRGLTNEKSWRDVEMLHGPWGEPRLLLHGEAARLAEEKGLPRCAVSLSHTPDYAIAVVLFTG